MTKDERQFVAGLLHAIDAILEGLAHGEGVDHWWQFFAAWTAEGEPLGQQKASSLDNGCKQNGSVSLAATTRGASMSKYSELAERLGRFRPGPDDHYLDRAASALRELEAENRLYSESLANATQEIERLREAFLRIADTDPDDGTDWFHSVARAALEGKG